MSVNHRLLEMILWSVKKIAVTEEQTGNPKCPFTCVSDKLCLCLSLASLRLIHSHTLRDGCSPCFKMRQLTFTPAEEVRVLAGAQARIGTQVYWPPGSVLPYGSCSSRDGDLNLATLPRVFLQHQTPDKIIRAITSNHSTF